MQNNDRNMTELKICVVDTSALTDTDFYMRAREHVSPARKKKADSLHNENDRRLCIGAALALDILLAPLGFSERSLAVGRNEFGMPLTGIDSLHISISHSGKYSACAISECPCGIDIESVLKTDDTSALRIAKRFFHKNEYARLENCGHDPACEFCAVWTARESYMKLTGRGFSEPRHSFETAADGKSLITSDGHSFPLIHYDLGDYILSACSYDPETVFPKTVVPLACKKDILPSKA